MIRIGDNIYNPDTIMHIEKVEPSDDVNKPLLVIYMRDAQYSRLEFDTIEELNNVYGELSRAFKRMAIVTK